MSSLSHLLIVIGFLAVGAFAAALGWSELRRSIRPFSKGDVE